MTVQHELRTLLLLLLFCLQSVMLGVHLSKVCSNVSNILSEYCEKVPLPLCIGPIPATATFYYLILHTTNKEVNDMSATAFEYL